MRHKKRTTRGANRAWHTHEISPAAAATCPRPILSMSLPLLPRPCSPSQSARHPPILQPAYARAQLPFAEGLTPYDDQVHTRWHNFTQQQSRISIATISCIGARSMLETEQRRWYLYCVRMRQSRGISNLDPLLHFHALEKKTRQSPHTQRWDTCPSYPPI